MKNNDRAIANNVNEIVIPLYLLAFIVIGLFQQSPKEILQGLFETFTHPGMLITDYMVIGGVGAALINGALVGLVGYGILKLNKVPMNGPSIATIFTMVGFGLFGKRVVDSAGNFRCATFLPYPRTVFPGTCVSRAFGTALAPMVTRGIWLRVGIVTGIIVGILSGMIIPPLANHLLIVHEGYNLYNVGFTAGLWDCYLSTYSEITGMTVSLWRFGHGIELHFTPGFRAHVFKHDYFRYNPHQREA